MKRKFFLFAALLCLLAATACAAPEETAPEETAPQTTTEQAAEAETKEIAPEPLGQDAATTAYEQIMETLDPLLPDDPAYPGYPAEFGDCYYQDGCLWVCLTENTPEMQEKYRAMVDTPQVLQFQEVAYSYNDLYALQNAIVETEGLTWSAVGVNVTENRVDVTIPDLTREEAALALIVRQLPPEVEERFSEYPIAFDEGTVFLS